MNKKLENIQMSKSDAMTPLSIIVLLIGVIVMALSGIGWVKMQQQVFKIESGTILFLYVLFSIAESILNGMLVGAFALYRMIMWTICDKGKDEEN